MSIDNNVRELLSSIPSNVALEAAAKTRSREEVLEVIKAGVGIIGENYLQEAEELIPLIGEGPRWHFIGTLQSGKIRRIVSLFDMIETVGSLKHAELIDKHSGDLGKVMPVLIEVNSGREEQKAGVHQEDVMDFVGELAALDNIRVSGLMTMGKMSGDVSVIRECFSITRSLFEKMKKAPIPNLEPRYLSMGMSSSYRLAIEEGANLIRIGEGIFGPRVY